MARFHFEVRSSWDGRPLHPDEHARIGLRLGNAIEVEIEAADYGDPAPLLPSGRCDGLWNFEVVELFLLGRDDEYLELEFGPHGHYLALRLAGRRQIIANDLPVEYTVERRGGRWHGRARARIGDLPPDLVAANAYAIHGQGASRRYLAWQPVPGAAPDFHRLDHFGALSLAAQSSRASSIPEVSTKGTP